MTPLSVGVTTPPIRQRPVFVLVEIDGCRFERVVVAVLPFLVPIILVIVLLILVPDIVTFLPELLE